MPDDFLRRLLDEYAEVVGEVRADAKADAYARVRRPEYDDELPDHTQLFLKALKHEIPKDGRVIFVNVPTFGSPGDGKTTGVLTTALHLVEHYGEDKVSVHLSDHLPTLVDAMRARATPVVVLIGDDVLKNYSSRAGGSAELLEAIRLFTTLRHEYEAAHHTLDGIVYVFWTSQMYKGTEKVFREGLTVFKSELASDKDEILKATRMSRRAWAFLSRLKREVVIEHRQDRLSDGVVCLPGYEGGGLLRLTPYHGPLLDRLIARSTEPEAATIVRHGSVAQKYKLLERLWTAPRRRLTKEEELARFDALLENLAASFVREREEDVASATGQAVLRTWVHRRMYGLDVEPRDRLESEDYLGLQKAYHAQALKAKILEARRREALARLAGEGVAVGKHLTENELLDYVARRLLAEGFNPYFPPDKDRYLSLLYRLPPDIRATAIALRSAIFSRIKDLHQAAFPRDEPSAGGAAPAVEAPKNLPPPGAVEFELDAAAFLQELVDEARRNGDSKHLRDLLVFQACKFPAQYEGRSLDTPTMMAQTPEGQAWQRERFQQSYSRPELQKSKTSGSSFYHNRVGLLFEAWVARQLRAGFVIAGLFDRAPIIEVIQGGGNGHDPDLTVLYADARRDYVSLKCYHQDGPISITTNPARGTDEIQPERKALLRDEAQGVLGNRVVVLLRNTYHAGWQGYRVFVATRDIPPTLGFNRQDIGGAPWVPAASTLIPSLASEVADAP